MAEIKDKVVTVESLSALHEYNKTTYMSTTTISIPAGRMRGDINADGKITTDDANLVSSYYVNEIEFDELQLQCADFDQDNVVGSSDIRTIQRIVNGIERIGTYGDVLGNWMTNPNFETEDMQFYTDIVVKGLTTEDSVIIIIADENYDKNFFYAECIEGAIRVYAKLCPIFEVKAMVQYGKSNATPIVIIDSLRKSAKYLYDIVPIANGGTNASDGATGLKNLFAEGITVLSSYQYGDTLPEAGTVGRVFFKRLIEE